MLAFQFELTIGDRLERQIGLALRAHGDQIRPPAALIENLDVSIADPTGQTVRHKVSAHSEAELPLFVWRSLGAMPTPVLASPTERRGRLDCRPEGVRVKPRCRARPMDGAVGRVNHERAFA